MKFRVLVWPIPDWLDWKRLLGPGEWELGERADGFATRGAKLERGEAADLSARLRGVGIGGHKLTVEILPSLNRKELRLAASEEARRHRERSIGFSKKAVQLDDEARFSLTPEAIALELGNRVRGQRIIDACAGAGGNAIGFARAGCDVIAIELDRGRIEMARHNARLYGVADRIQFICGDACEIVPRHAADLLFIDAPWGENYNKERVLLDDLPPCAELLDAGRKTWIKVPPSFDPTTLPGCRVEAIFGAARGDERRVKFLLLEAGSDDLPLPRV